MVKINLEFFTKAHLIAAVAFMPITIQFQPFIKFSFSRLAARFHALSVCTDRRSAELAAGSLRASGCGTDVAALFIYYIKIPTLAL